jgi:hypothetical protein
MESWMFTTSLYLYMAEALSEFATVMPRFTTSALCLSRATWLTLRLTYRRRGEGGAQV